MISREGAEWRAPRDTGVMPSNAIVLHGWSFVDLELDPVRHERTGIAEIEDDDEFRDACDRGWIGEAEATVATTAAHALANALRRRTEP